MAARLLAGEEGAFIDVGANIGQTLLGFHWSNSNARYLGLEPNPSAAHIVGRVIAHNGLTRHAVRTVACGERDGVVQLFVGRGRVTDTRATTDRLIRPERQYDAIDVEVASLDRVVADAGIDRVGVVKVDVEGGELQVLRGMRTLLTAQRPPVLCEVLVRDQGEPPIRHATRMDALTSLIDEVDYDAYPLRELRECAAPVSTFPSREWSRRDRDRCDYALLPRENAGSLLTVMRRR